MVSSAVRRKRLQQAKSGDAVKRSRQDDVSVGSGQVHQLPDRSVPLDSLREALLTGLSADPMATLEHIWAHLGSDDVRSQGVVLQSPDILRLLHHLFLQSDSTDLAIKAASVLAQLFVVGELPTDPALLSQLIQRIHSLISVVVHGEGDLAPLSFLMEVLMEQEEGVDVPIIPACAEAFKRVAVLPLTSALGFVPYLHRLGGLEDGAVLEAIVRNVPTAPEDYADKAFRIAANLPEDGKVTNVMCKLIALSSDEEEERCLLNWGRLDLAMAVAAFLCNSLSLLQEEEVAALGTPIEAVLATLKCNHGDSTEALELYCALMAALSNTGIWACDAVDLLQVVSDMPAELQDSLRDYIAIVAHFTRQHRQGTKEELRAVEALLANQSQ